MRLVFSPIILLAMVALATTADTAGKEGEKRATEKKVEVVTLQSVVSLQL
jgi:hypothetical protein